MRRVAVEERRARLARRHHLAPGERSDDPVEVARDLVGLHATDPATVHLAALARLRDPVRESVEQALYDDRTLVRVLGMRRTMFVLPRDLAGVVGAACTRTIAVRERKKLVQHLEQGGIASDGAAWLARVEPATLAAIEARGDAAGGELSADVPELAERLHWGEGKAYEARPAVSSRVLFLLAADGRIIRGRPRGGWTSGQFRWTPLATWLPEGLPEPPPAEAQATLVRAWLRVYGPGTEADLRWWSGLGAGEVRRALAALETVAVDLEGQPGLLLADDAEPVDPPAPWAALLPALDPTPMGWTGRDWYLDPHSAALFDRSGNIGPTIWSNGRIVGGWARRADGEIALRLLEDVGAEAMAAVEAEAARLGAAIGETAVTPRFRTPVERELAG